MSSAVQKLLFPPPLCPDPVTRPTIPDCSLFLLQIRTLAPKLVPIPTTATHFSAYLWSPLSTFPALFFSSSVNFPFSSLSFRFFYLNNLIDFSFQLVSLLTSSSLLLVFFRFSFLSLSLSLYFLILCSSPSFLRPEQVRPLPASESSFWHRSDFFVFENCV